MNEKYSGKISSINDNGISVGLENDFEGFIQAQDRIHRISQDKDCYVYNILMNASIDDWVDSLIKAKQVAAHFGQGDIDKEEYQSRMIYDLRSQLERVLDSGGRNEV